MNKDIPRLRMFAGPNGSGKSTIKSVLSPELLGIYINPDEIEQQILRWDFLDLARYGVKTTGKEISKFFSQSSLLKKADLLGDAQHLSFSDDKLIFSGTKKSAYFASVAADLIRQKLIESRQSFTFETVMSSPDKITLLEKAQKIGYRTYLYYVATEDPRINLSRIQYRIKMGGHAVPEKKVISRYKRSLNLLIQAVQLTNRAYIFDNSSHEHIWLAEVTHGIELEMKSNQMPIWFKKALWDRFSTKKKVV